MLCRINQMGQNQSGNILGVGAGTYAFMAVLVIAVVLTARHQFRQTQSDKKVAIVRYGSSTLQGQMLTIAGRIHRVTSGTRAEVVGMVEHGRRSTVTRTVAGGVVAGPVGALAGHAAKKKTATSNAILTIDGDDWAESIPVGTKSYPEAVAFAQAVNLAARRAVD